MMKNNNLLQYFSKKELLSISKNDNLHNKAEIIAYKLFANKKDKSGKPYINHLLRVSEKLIVPIEKIAGLLHDTIEDTDVTVNDLLDVGFPKEVTDIVVLVTNDNNDTLSKEEKLIKYSQKIDNIIDSGNIHAIRLKLADMSDNYDLTRLRELPLEKQEWFHLKYSENIQKLRDYLEKN